MQPKDIIKTLFLGTLILTFTACGGGGDGSFEEETIVEEPIVETPVIETPISSTIEISVPCVTDPTQNDIESYITLESGDTISKEGEVTIITYHDSDGVKKVCKDETSTGSAFIEKGKGL